MSLDIEKYLKKNRLKLDADQPDDDRIWNGIGKEIKKEKTTNFNWLWKVAAVFLFGVLVTYVVVKETTQQQVVIVTLADVSKELGQQEATLKLVVDKKWSEIGPLSAAVKLEFQFLLDELTELDKVYKMYEKDLQEFGANEQTINVLLDYYEKKIRILNRLSLEIQKQKSHENKITI